MFRTTATIFLALLFVTDFVSSKKSTDNDDGKSSLVFVFDTTGSMHNDLKQLREGAEMILNTAMNESNIIADFVFVPFHDPAVGPATVTRNKKEFQEALNIVHVYGGGDCPEKSLGGIQLALNVSRPRSFVYVFTDATASDHRFVGKVLDSVQRKQSQVVFVLTGHCNDLDKPTFKVYQQIAAASSGQVFNLNKTSVHKVLEFVRTSIKARSVNLGSLVNPAGYNFTQEIPVDSTLGEVTVSVSGSKPQIRVVNPSGEELTGPPKLVTTLDLSEIMVVKVLQPEPGNWRITVGSEENYSVKVVGSSNLTFDHGFSVEKPASIAETSYRPLRGTYNNMMIKLTQTDIPVHVSYAEILSLNGTPLFEVPLKEVDRENKVYLADAFMPPDEFFYIAINGHDQYNQELRRTGATAVQAKLPDVPYLTALRKMKVRPHERVVLICNVESLVPVTSKWTKDSVRIQPETSSLQTTSIEFAIEDMNEEHVGTYVCSAHNVAGHSKTTTELILLVDPPQVTIEPINATLELEEDLTISCTIVSEAMLLKYQMFFNGVDMNIGNDRRLEPNLAGVYNINKTIKSVDENNTGLYTCVATNRGGQTNQSTYIQVRSQPITHILGSHTLHEAIHSDIQIVCEVENADTLRWMAPNSTIVKEYRIRDKNVKHKDVLILKNETAGGVWQCMGFSGSHSDADSIEINIEMKPKVSIEGAKNITIVNGTSHVIVCIVEAKPAPRILWHRESEEFLNHSVTHLKTDYYKSILTLNSSKENVEGTYFCIGENSQGIDQDSIAVNVRRTMTLVNGFSDISVELYYQVELQCEVDSYPLPRVHWYHNGTDLQVNNNLHLSEDNTTVYVKKVEFDNLGFYMCEVENGFERITVNGTLSVHGLDSPTILKESSSHDARKGQPTLITCSVTGNPEPRKTWQYKNKSSDSYTSLPRGVIVNDDEDLTISNVALQHSGIYRCVADNVVGRDEHDTELVVNYPPELSLEDNSNGDAPRKVEVGGKVEFSCKAVGSPPPMITWTKNGHPVVYNKNLYLTDANKLVLQNATAKDAGLFTCKAKNALGSSERNYTLVVYMSPNITTSNIDSQQEVLEGQLVELPCSVEGVPTPIVTWKQDDNIIENRRKYIDEFGLRFVANQTDSGMYSCTASNEHGTMSLTYTLSVWVPPSIEPLESSKRVLHGTNITIGCKAVGLPTPTIFWKFQEDVLKENTSHVSFNDQGVLYINNASSELEGNYTCVATNKAGVASQSTRLIINDPPELSLKDDAVDVDAAREVEVGGKVELSCKAVGSPPPMITWTKNGHPVVYTKNLYLTEENALVLENATPKDAGVFTCKAKSALGSSERNYTLVVYMSPKIATPNIKSQQEVSEGQLVELPCSVEGVPTPIVTWKQDGNIIEESRKYIDEFGLRFVANQTDSGMYSCTVSNEHGTMSLTYTLSVWVPPSIESLESSKRVLHGTNVTIECKAVGLPTPTIVWKFQEDVLKENTSHVSFNDLGVLYINNASSELEGNYTCVATNKAGVASQSTRFIINDPPELSLKDDSVDVDAPREVEVGGKVEFSCKAVGSPPPMITWTKNGHPVVYTKNLHLTDANDLVLENATAKDAGVFTCKAKSALGSSERNYTLVVYMRPNITTSNIDPQQEVLEGQLVELPCSVEGVPTPIVTWKQDDNIIKERRKYIDEFGLRFVANLSDFGNYSCTASNEHGMTSLTYALSVWVPPSIGPLEPSKAVLKGTNVTLECNVVGFPIPIIVWEFQGKLLTENTSHVSFNDQGVLFINNASSELEGVYCCVAENNAGVASQSTRIIINEPPKILPDNYTGSYLATILDTAVTVACQTTGKPKPYIIWSKDDFYLDRDSRYSIEVDGSLTINSPTVDLSGNYTCTAKNSVGKVNKTVAVEIYSLPTTMQSDESLISLTVLEGTNTSIQCPAQATHSASINWYKDAKLISQGLLNISNVSRNDASTYACVVKNAIGSALSTIQLKVEWPPKFLVNDTRDIEVIRGDDRYFDCGVDSKPAAKTRWLFNSKPILFEDKVRLKLMNIQLHNTGIYKCIVSNIHGTVVKQFMLDVLVPPFISEFDLLDVQLKEGSNATLECNARGSPEPKVSWTFHNEDWHMQNSTLTAVHVTSNSEGLFRCDASNKAGSTHIVYRVTVVSGAKITEVVSFSGGEGTTVDNSVEAVLGTRLRVSCIATGEPRPDVQWIRNGIVISRNSKSINYADLVFTDIQRSNSGVYSCIATNEGDSDERRIKVNILEPPKIFQNLFETPQNDNVINLEVISGQAFYLHCHPYGNPMPEVYWFRDEVPLKLFDDTMVSSEFGEVISVRRAMFKQSGNYTCVARNSVGNSSIAYLVDVLVPPPTLKESSKKVSLQMGKQLNLTCPVQGSPAPYAMWIKHPYIEITEDTPRVQLFNDNYTLIINNTDISDSGRYSCIMTNKVGTTEYTFNVTIRKPPTIAGNLPGNNVEDHIVPLRRSVVLKCETDGNPLPIISWLKDTQQLSDNLSSIQRVLGNSLLSIRGASVRDAGQYICVVENEAGSAHRRYNVVVQVPGKWGPWSQWSTCNVTCGVGSQLKYRSCYYVDDDNNTIDKTSQPEKIVIDESGCRGPTSESRKCHMPLCEVVSESEWSAWSRWSPCSATCGVATQARTRTCYSHIQCIGDNVQIRKCPDLPKCSRDPSENEVYTSRETNETDSYLPEVTFEMQPDIGNSQSPFEVEEFTNNVIQKPPVYFDVNVTVNLDGSENGPCDLGYSYNPILDNCNDIDECLIESNQCHSTQVCVNTKGAYSCTCQPGFVSLGAGQRCLDINECSQELHGCQFACVNVAGGYVCACPRHLRLHQDRHHCVTPSSYQNKNVNSYEDLDPEV